MFIIPHPTLCLPQVNLSEVSQSIQLCPLVDNGRTTTRGPFDKTLIHLQCQLTF